VPVAGLQNGSPFTVTVVANPPAYTLYLNQRHAVDLTDNNNAAIGNMGFGCLGQGGTVHVTGARAYALP
jgi:hypothetical protein